jgi:PAS domain S-box-containing protein
MTTLHDLSGRDLYISPSIEAFAGCRPEELVGAPCWAMTHPDDVPRVQQTMAAAELARGPCPTVRRRGAR